MTEQRNLILAIVLSLLIMLGFQYLLPSQDQQPQPQQQTTATGTPSATSAVPTPAPAPAAAPVNRAQAIANAQRVRISTPSLHGSIALTGGRVDDLTLVKYRETTEPNSPEITLLSPPGAPNPYYAEFGWVAADGKTAVPGAETQWQQQGSGELTPSSPMVLTWDNGQGLRFTRSYAVDENYMFSVTQKVENTGAAPVALHPYGVIARTGKPETGGYSILHEGPLGVLGGSLEEHGYDELDSEGKIETKSQGGWLGITDKYWLTSLVPDQSSQFTGRFLHRRDDAADKYQVDYLAEPRTVAPGQTVEITDRLFAGAKEVDVLDAYKEKHNIPLFERSIDFGMFWFLTIPFFHLLKLIHGLVGNFGISILLLTVLVKGAFYPLANKSYVAMSKMKKLQPDIKKLQERHGEDKMRLQQEMMALYKREKVNPVSGCLPVIIQIPVFFALYKVLFVTIEMRHAPFFGWIRDLSAPDPTTIFNLFGLIPWSPPSFLMLGLWPLIMGVTMWLQQRLNPQPADPIQAKMFMILPIVFTFLLSSFPAGLVIYWAWSNILSIAQQSLIMKRMGVKP